MTSFASLKRKSKDSYKKLAEELQKTASNSSNFTDDRIWTAAVDKAGNGFAIIRFLPTAQVDGDDALPWVRVFDHGFQGPGGWYIENCPTTINQPCPCCAENSINWNSGIEANKDIARKRKRRLKYISNILVIKDPANPDNDGKQFLYKYGKKIYDKIQEMAVPVEDPIDPKEPVNVFDFWAGANFKLKIRRVEGYQNYDKSEFDAVSAVFQGDDQQIEELWKNEYSLQEFLNPKEFKTFTELSTRFNRVFGGAPASLATANEDYSVMTGPAAAAPKVSQSREETPIEETSTEESSDGDKDTLDYFSKLADQTD